MKRGFVLSLAVALMLLSVTGAAQAVDVTVPEIDGSSMASALTLLTGVGVLLADGMRRRLKAS